MSSEKGEIKSKKKLDNRNSVCYTDPSTLKKGTGAKCLISLGFSKSLI